MKLFTNEVKIALVAIVGVVVLFFGLKFMKGLTMFSTDDNYYARFSNVSGLSASSPVYANGFRVGVVERIDFNYNRPEEIVATIGLDNQLQIPRGTTAEITSDLLGNVKLELRFGPNPADLLAKGDTIEGGMQEGAMAKAASMLPQIEQILPKIDSILVAVNTLLADPAISHSLQNLAQMTDNLSATTRNINQLSATLGSQAPAMLAKVDTILTNVALLTSTLNSMNLEQMLANVDATLANVKQVTEQLNSKEGSVGLLLRDPGLYYNLTATMQAADSLLQDIKQHPSRYINVSVFGRKSK